MMGDMAAKERRFVIVTPHQSVGPPGTEVLASQLGMNDEKLDEWVDAGHATEIHARPTTSAPVTKVTRVADSATTSTSSSKTTRASSKSDDGSGDDQ